MHPSIQYKYDVEEENKINYLDLTIYRQEQRFSIGVSRKPTFTDVMIRNDSNHPLEHKLSGIKYALDRANKLPMNPVEKRKEINTIYTIASNNGYDVHTTMKLRQPKKKAVNQTKVTDNPLKDKWAKFTYIGKQIRTLTKIFKNTNIKIAYTTNNTIKKRCGITTQENKNENKYTNSGVYKLKCNTCDKIMPHARIPQ
jgi:hypothetical protein